MTILYYFLKTPPVKMLFFFTIFYLAFNYFFEKKGKNKGFDKIIDILSYFFIFPVIVHLFSVISYLFYPTFFDHVEPTVASLSYLAGNSLELYHSLKNSNLSYSILYGPNLFLLPGFFCKIFGYSIFNIKLFFALCSIGSVIFFYLAMLKKLKSIRGAIVSIGIYSFCFQLLGMPPIASRAEPLILFLVSFGLWGYTTFFTKIKLRKYIWISIAALLMNVKIHGFLYMTSFFFFESYEILNQSRYKRIFSSLLNAYLLPSLFFIFLLFFPFLLPGISVTHFFEVLKNATSHHLLGSLFFQNVGFFSQIFIIPFLLLFFILRDKSVDKKRIIDISFVFIPEFIIIVLASKAGAGIGHLFPLIPLNIFFITQTFQIKTEDKNTNVKNLLFTLILSFLFISVSNFKHSTKIFMSLYSNAHHPQEIAKEVKEIAKKYSNNKIHMGFSSDTSYYLTYFRTELLFKGNSLCFDPASMMDLYYSDNRRGDFILDNCLSDIILIPIEENKNAVWSLSNWYNGQFLLKETFREKFLKDWTLIETTPHFRIYFRNKT